MAASINIKEKGREVISRTSRKVPCIEGFCVRERIWLPSTYNYYEIKTGVKRKVFRVYVRTMENLYQRPSQDSIVLSKVTLLAVNHV